MQDKTENLNSPVYIKEIELPIKKKSYQENVSPRCFHWWIPSSFQGKNNPNLTHKLSENTEKKILNEFDEANISLISKTWQKHFYKSKLQINVPQAQMCKVRIVFGNQLK